MLFKVAERLKTETMSVHAFAVLSAEFQSRSGSSSGQRSEWEVVLR